MTGPVTPAKPVNRVKSLQDEKARLEELIRACSPEFGGYSTPAQRERLERDLRNTQTRLTNLSLGFEENFSVEVDPPKKKSTASEAEVLTAAHLRLADLCDILADYVDEALSPLRERLALVEGSIAKKKGKQK